MAGAGEVGALSRYVESDNTAEMIDLQGKMLSRFEKTNEMLLNFNRLSNSRFVEVDLQFKKHLLLLTNSRKDLDLIFKRIRVLKKKLSKHYPTEFEACTHVYEVPDDDATS